jgi:hypothetical protein
MVASSASVEFVSRIAFQGARGDILVMNAEGSHLRQLTRMNF